jgi:hypothetical protein
MAEDSHNPGSIDHISRLYPTAATFLTKRIAKQLSIRCERLREARVAHGIAAAAGACDAGQHCLASLQASKLVNPDNQVGVRVRPPTFPFGIPMPPAQTFPAKFECQLCFQVINLSVPNEWTTHVYDDLEPFTCTYEQCGDSMLFKRRCDWFRHENERHRQVELWVCGECKPTESGGRIPYTCLKGYVRNDNFEEHLKRVHGFSDKRAKAMVEECHYIKTNPGNERQLDLWVCRELSVGGEKTSKSAGETSDVYLKGFLRLDNFKGHLKAAHKFSDKQAKAMAKEYHYIKTDLGNEPCRLCGRVFKEFKLLISHLAEHLEHISWYSLQDVGHHYQEQYQCYQEQQHQHQHQHQQKRKRKRNHQKQQDTKKRARPLKMRDELQKLLVWYSNLPTPPAEFINIKGTAAAIQVCEILQLCQMKGVENMCQDYNLREPTLISNYSVRIIQIVIQSTLKRRKVQELLAWYGSLPKPLTEVFGIRGIGALAQVCEIIQTCQRNGVDAVHHDMKLQLNYSIRNIGIGIQSATLLQDNNEEAQMEDDTNMEDGTDMEDDADEDDDTDDNSQHPTQTKEVRKRFTLEEDTILVQLRNKGWRWKDIAYKLKGRHSAKSLQKYYLRKARER